MNRLTQSFQLLRISLLSLPARAGPSLVVIIGMAGVVGLVIVMMAAASTFENTLRRSGHEDRAIVLRKGSVAELTSAIPHDALSHIADAPGVRRGAAGAALISAEALAATTLHRRSDGTEAAGQVRGVGSAATVIRPELHIVAGRYFRPGALEAIVGKTARRQYREMDLGQKIRAENVDWVVVGVFETGGDLHESFAFVDADTLMSVSHRQNYSSVTALLQSPDVFPRFSATLTADPSLAVDVYRETDYFDRQAGSIRRLFAVLRYGIGGIMIIGAAFAAANTMFSAASSRAREIATLRAIGYQPGPTVLAMLAESAMLASLGALCGAALAFSIVNGRTFGSNLTGGSTSQLIFQIDMVRSYFVTGLVLACVVGMAGALIPAVRAARVPVATALRRG